MEKGIDFKSLDFFDEKNFLESNYFFDFTNGVIEKTVKEITKECLSDKQKAVSLFYFVRDRIPYTMYTGFDRKENYRAGEVLRKGKGFCIQKAVLLVAMLRCAGIPSLIAFADIINFRIPAEVSRFLGTNIFPYHGFVFLRLNGKWLKATPTFDRESCLKAGYLIVDFDGEKDCYLPSHTEDGKRFVEYVKFHGAYNTVPLGDILEAWKRVYGEERMALWIKMSSEMDC